MKESGAASAKEIAIRATFITIIANLTLSLFKFIAGLLGKSSAMISDAVHSASDVFSSIIVVIGVQISSKKSDATHQYGHDRLESIASVFLSAVLFLTGAGIGYSGLQKIFMAYKNNFEWGTIEVPTILPLIAAVVSIGIKEGMYWYTRAVAKRVNSTVLMADAWHHRSDAFSSVGSLIGIVGARLGFPILDPIASVVISIMIVKAAYDICRSAVEQMVDRSCSEETNREIEQIALSIDGVKKVDLLMTRLFGSKFYVDIEISVDGQQTLFQAHDISQRVHDAIEEKYPDAKHCMVHMNPYTDN